MPLDESACEASPYGKSCPTGSWCCMNEQAGKSECVPCKTTVFGRCLNTAVDACSAAGLKPWNQLADVEQAAVEAGKTALQKAFQDAMAKYVNQ